MKNFKKILSMVLAAVLLVALSVGVTVAYLTYEADPVENTFTVGDISIGLDEVVDTEGRAEVSTEREEGAVAGGDYTNIMPGDKLIKIPTVTNTGKNPAYVALTVTVNNALLINQAIDEFYEAKGYTEDQIQAIYDDVFEGWDLVHKKVDAEGNALGMRLTCDKELTDILLHVDSVKTMPDYWQVATANWFSNENDVQKAGYPFTGYYTTGMNPYELKYTYYLHLDAGESFTPFQGLNVPAEFNREQLQMFEGLNIKVEAAAIQADNMPTAEYAFKALHGDELPELVESNETLTEVLKNGGDIVLTADLAGDNYAVETGADVELDMAGNALDTKYVNNFGTLTLENGTLNSGTSADYAFINRPGADVTFNDVDISANGGGIGVIDSKVVINGGSLTIVSTTTNPRYAIYAGGSDSEVVINGGTFSVGKESLKRAYVYAFDGATVYINGGTFGVPSNRDGYKAGILTDGASQVIITGGTFGFDPSAWVADGYEAVQNGSTWTVSAK